MSRGAFAKSKIILPVHFGRESKRVEQRYFFSKLSGNSEASTGKGDGPERAEMESRSTWSSSWIPDSRTGIYFPRGHEKVIDDVPDGAASLNNQTFWMRSLHGVLEKPDPDTCPDHY